MRPCFKNLQKEETKEFIGTLLMKDPNKRMNS